MKPKLLMLIGLPGSGKSYEAELLEKEHNAVIHSSDAIREELSGSAEDMSINQRVFDTLHQRVIDSLKAGQNCIYDATNISSKRRIHFLKNVIKDVPCEKIAIVMATPYKQCLENNLKRARQVPEDVIKRMYTSWQTPYYYEGFDLIQIVLWQGKYQTPQEWVENHMTFEQENSHHTLTLGAHSLKVYQSIRSSCDELYYAAMLHDCGKPFTKAFKDSKGNATEEAHYYQHSNVGAYDSFFYMSNIVSVDSLLVSWMIEKHMEMHLCDKDSVLANKRRKLWGNDLYILAEHLHQADMEAH